MAFIDAALGWRPSVVSVFFLVFILVVTLVWFFKGRRKTWLVNQIPGPKTIPIFGNALYLAVEQSEQLNQLVKLGSYGKVSRLWLFDKPIVVVSGAKEAEVILSSQKHITKGYVYKFLRPWIGSGLVTSTGEEWFTHRKLLTPSFHFKILEDFMVVFNEQSRKLVDKLQEKADGRVFDMFTMVNLCTLDIICETAMGQSINAQDSSESEYVKAIHTISTIVFQRVTKAWLDSDFIFNLTNYSKEHKHCLEVIHSFTREAIMKKRRQRTQQLAKKDAKADEDRDDEVLGKKKYLAFMDMLLEASDDGKNLSDESIEDEVNTFMFAGHDTTNSAINWTLYMLGDNPEIQDKVYDELDSIFGGSDRPATMNDLREMNYLENCIKESMRVYPSVQFISREIQEDLIIGGYQIPSGVTVMVLLYAIHKDPEQFPNPNVYDPDRFLVENSRNRNPYAFTPFSAGPRNCIGQKFAMMEMKVTLSSILRSYRVESTVKREDLKVVAELILRPEGGNMLKLFPRDV